jgi:hypothetical protein
VKNGGWGRLTSNAECFGEIKIIEVSIWFDRVCEFIEWNEKIKEMWIYLLVNNILDGYLD